MVAVVLLMLCATRGDTVDLRGVKWTPSSFKSLWYMCDMFRNQEWSKYLVRLTCQCCTIMWQLWKLKNPFPWVMSDPAQIRLANLMKNFKLKKRINKNTWPLSKKKQRSEIYGNKCGPVDYKGDKSPNTCQVCLWCRYWVMCVIGVAWQM